MATRLVDLGEAATTRAGGIISNAFARSFLNRLAEAVSRSFYHRLGYLDYLCVVRFNLRERSLRKRRLLPTATETS
jgi:hypothetical protein